MGNLNKIVPKPKGNASQLQRPYRTSSQKRTAAPEFPHCEWGPDANHNYVKDLPQYLTANKTLAQETNPRTAIYDTNMATLARAVQLYKNTVVQEHSCTKTQMYKNTADTR